MLRARKPYLYTLHLLPLPVSLVPPYNTKLRSVYSAARCERSVPAAGAAAAAIGAAAVGADAPGLIDSP